MSEVVNIIIRWLELGREIPEKVDMALAKLRNQVNLTDRALVDASREVAEFVLRQGYMGDIVRANAEAFEKGKRHIIDINDILEDLTTTYIKKSADGFARFTSILKGVPLVDLYQATRRALPAIGAEIEKLKETTTGAGKAMSYELAGIGIIAQHLAEQLKGVSAPKISRALEILRKKTGLTSEDIIDAFWIAAKAQHDVSELMKGDVSKLAAVIRSRHEDIIRALRRHDAIQAELARKGLSYLRGYENVISTQTFLRDLYTRKFQETGRVIKKWTAEEAKAHQDYLQDYKRWIEDELTKMGLLEKKTQEVASVVEKTTETQAERTSEASQAMLRAILNLIGVSPAVIDKFGDMAKGLREVEGPIVSVSELAKRFSRLVGDIPPPSYFEKHLPVVLDATKEKLEHLANTADRALTVRDVLDAFATSLREVTGATVAIDELRKIVEASMQLSEVSQQVAESQKVAQKSAEELEKADSALLRSLLSFVNVTDEVRSKIPLLGKAADIPAERLLNLRDVADLLAGYLGKTGKQYPKVFAPLVQSVRPVQEALEQLAKTSETVALEDVFRLLAEQWAPRLGTTTEKLMRFFETLREQARRVPLEDFKSQLSMAVVMSNAMAKRAKQVTEAAQQQGETLRDVEVKLDQTVDATDALTAAGARLLRAILETYQFTPEVAKRFQGFAQAMRLTQDEVYNLVDIAPVLARQLGINVSDVLRALAETSTVVQKRLTNLAKTTEGAVPLSHALAVISTVLGNKLGLAGEQAERMAKDFAKVFAKLATGQLEVVRFGTALSQSMSSTAKNLAPLTELGERLYTTLYQLASGEKLTKDQAEALVSAIDRVIPGFAEAIGASRASAKSLRFLGRTISESSPLWTDLTAAAAKSSTQLGETVYRLASNLGNVQDQINQVAQSLIKSEGQMDEQTASIWRNIVATLGWRDAASLLGRAIDRIRKQMRRNQRETRNQIRWLSRLEREFYRAGWRLGWFGYRMVMIGRIVTRWLMTPIRRVIRDLSAWDKSMNTVATTMGFMAAAGELTAERQAFLESTLERLAELGPEFAAAWGYLQSALIALSAEAGPPLIELFYSLGDLIRELTPIIADVAVPAIQELVSTIIQILPSLRPILEVAIPEFIRGLQSTLPVMFAFVNAVKPLIPLFARLAGMIAPLAPVLTGIGMALYFLSPAFEVLSGVLRAVSFLFGQFSVAAGAVSIPLSALIPIILAIAYAVTTLIVHWERLVNSWNTIVGPGIEHLSAAFGRLSSALGISVDWLGVLRIVTEPLARQFEMFFAVLRVGIELFAWIIDRAADIINFFKSLGSWIATAMGLASRSANDARKAFDEFHKSQRDLSDTIDRLYGHSVGELVASNMKLVVDSMRLAQNAALSTLQTLSRFEDVPTRVSLSIDTSALEDLRSNLATLQAAANVITEVPTPTATAVPSTSPPTQYITVPVTIYVGEISAEVDLEEVKDAVVRGISEALQR